MLGLLPFPPHFQWTIPPAPDFIFVLPESVILRGKIAVCSWSSFAWLLISWHIFLLAWSCLLVWTWCKYFRGIYWNNSDKRYHLTHFISCSLQLKWQQTFHQTYITGECLLAFSHPSHHSSPSAASIPPPPRHSCVRLPLMPGRFLWPPSL